MKPDITYHLYIKHAVGSRMLFDVSGGNKPFELTETAEGWRFLIEQVEPGTVELLRNNAQELNIFYFEEQPGRPIRKSWLYDLDRPRIEYNEETRQCEIVVDTKKEYTNESV